MTLRGLFSTRRQRPLPRFRIRVRVHSIDGDASRLVTIFDQTRDASVIPSPTRPGELGAYGGADLGGLLIETWCYVE